MQTPFSVTLMFDRIETMAQDWSRFCYVVDLTEAKRPDPETRAALKGRVQHISPRVAHIAIVVGRQRDHAGDGAAVAHFMGLRSVSIHATRAEAIEEAGRAMER